MLYWISTMEPSSSTPPTSYPDDISDLLWQVDRLPRDTTPCPPPSEPCFDLAADLLDEE